MEMQQQLEWLEAQKVAMSVDLLAAAKQQLQFLASVEKNRYLYESPALELAIYRYNACWLPLLAKHSESPTFDGPLVVPFDCEWIWHCHRLNPVRYKTDCEELYGRILDNSNAVSSVKGICGKQTEEIWSRLYPDEPYVFDLKRASSAAINKKLSAIVNCTKYDLVSAVKRQSPFYYQVSRPHVKNDVFLEEAMGRYKGFLHLIKRNRERSIRRFCVPTYDIDLMWHTHQLHPVSYCKDLSEVLGKILEHDDMDSDRAKGKKLDVGFSETTKQWEETFGTRYWKAGAMYRGNAPSPITTVPLLPNILRKDALAENEYQKIIQLPELKIVEVLVEIVGIKNLPEEHKGSLFVTFSKKQPDVFFNVKQKLTILSESGKKQVASFQCEPKGELLFELISHSPSNLLVTKGFKVMGSASLSLQNFLSPISKLAVEKWVELLPSSGSLSSKPICLKIAVSFTVPTEAPHVLHLVHSRSLSSCFFSLPGKVPHAKGWTHVVDKHDTEIISLQMRGSKAMAKDKIISRKQVVGAVRSGETLTLAEFVGTRWSLMDSQWCLQLKTKSNEAGHLFELIGSRMIKFFQGRKLDFEPKQYQKQRNEQDFMTAVEFSTEDPYGKTIAMIDLKSGSIKVKEEWLVLPMIISAFILADILKNDGYEGFSVAGECLKRLDNNMEKASVFHEVAKQQIIQTASTEIKPELNVDAVKSGGCGSGCGTGCGSTAKSGGCGSGCGAGCGSMAKSGGCGSGCGAGCGNMVKSGGCGGGCGSIVESGGCGGGCGNMVKTGGCGSGCGSSGCGGCGSFGIGNMVESDGSATKASSVHNFHKDDACPKESTIHLSEAVAA